MEASFNTERRVWEKITLTHEFVSESCCFCDIDNDNSIELIAGEYWWKLDGSGDKQRFRVIKPSWLPHWPHSDKVDPHPHLREGGGEPQYRNSTYDWAIDLTGNGLKDVVWVGMHKDPIVWCENIGEESLWPTHEITSGGIYESVLLCNIIENACPSLVTIPQKNWVAWYEKPENPRERWKEHIIGFQGGDWHGLGYGDMDNDGEIEILTKYGVYFRRDDPRDLWKWKKIFQVIEDGQIVEGLGDVFNIEVTNFSSGEYPNLVSSSPHKCGIWYWDFEDEKNGALYYKRHTINETYSQIHSLRSTRFRNSVNNVVICGKRWQAHGIDGDINPYSEPVLLEFYDYKKAKYNIIDSESGVGLKFDVYSDERFDYIAVSNKKGVHCFKRKNCL